MKFRFYTWVLISLTILSIALLVLWKPWSKGPLSLDELLLTDREDVSYIEINSLQDSLEFQMIASQWQLGDEVLNQKAVENLLIAASDLSKKSILDIRELDNIKNTAEIVFHTKKKEVTRFDFGSSDEGFFISKRGNNTAFGVELLGFEKYPMERIFSLNADHYRDHLFIDLLPDEIKKISVQPVSGSAFMAIQDSSQTIVVKNLELEADTGQDIDDEKIRLLFSYFNSLRYNEHIKVKDLDFDPINSDPIAVVNVQSFLGQKWNIKIYPLRMKGEDLADIFKALVRLNDNEEYLSVNYFYLDLLIRGIEKYLTTSGQEI